MSSWTAMCPDILPGESQGQRSLLGCRLWGLAQSRTWLKQLSSSIVFIFPDSSVGKESACNAGDPDLIPGWGRSTGEWIGYPVQYSWASLVVQLVKNTPAMQETWVWSLGWEDPLERESLSSIQFSSVPQSWHFVTSWTVASQATLSITNSQRLLTLMSIESMMPSNHFILCHALLLLPSIFTSIRVSSNESVLCIR